MNAKMCTPSSVGRVPRKSRFRSGAIVLDMYSSSAGVHSCRKAERYCLRAEEGVACGSTTLGIVLESKVGLGDSTGLGDGQGVGGEVNGM